MAAMHVQRAVAAGVVALATLAACDGADRPDDQARFPAPEAARVAPADEALANVHLPTLDLARMVDAEIRQVLQAGPRCDFRYTVAGQPVLAYRAQPDGTPVDGVVKLNNHLVPLKPATAAQPSPATALASGPVRLVLRPEEAASAGASDSAGRRKADVILEVGDKLRVGYSGYVQCGIERQAAGVRH